MKDFYFCFVWLGQASVAQLYLKIVKHCIIRMDDSHFSHYKVDCLRYIYFTVKLYILSRDIILVYPGQTARICCNRFITSSLSLNFNCKLTITLVQWWRTGAWKWWQLSSRDYQYPALRTTQSSSVQSVRQKSVQLPSELSQSSYHQYSVLQFYMREKQF